jgi:hypothetical protein
VKSTVAFPLDSLYFHFDDQNQGHSAKKRWHPQPWSVTIATELADAFPR